MYIKNYQFRSTNPQKIDIGKINMEYTLLILDMSGLSNAFSPLVKFTIVTLFGISQGKESSLALNMV